MVPEAAFPLSVEDVLPLTEVLARTGKHFARLQRFFRARIPKGMFPARFELPIFKLVTAHVCFAACELRTPPESLFEVPHGFVLPCGEEDEEDEDGDGGEGDAEEE